jgi:hypothetical protein
MMAKIIDVIDNEPLNLRTTVYVNEHVPHEELPWMEFELPVPVSVNRFMSRLGNQTPVAREWYRRADMAFMALPVEMRRNLRCKIIGEFEAEYIFGPHAGDLSNRVKPLEDWLQSREFIENDRFCQQFVCKWAKNTGLNVPKGRVVVRLRPWMRP